MELPQLEAFLMAVEHRNFSKAATALGISQPSFSARIKALEVEAGDALFQRVGRGVRVTDAGRTLLPYVQRAMESLRTGKSALDASRAGTAGKLFIGAARNISTNVLPAVLEAFRARYPGVDLSIRTGRSSQVFQWVLGEEVQVGMARTLHHPDIATTHLYDEEVVLVTHPTHRFARAGTASIQEVASEPLILYDKESSYFVLIERVCREAGIVPNVQMDLDSIEATKRMIERNLGISFLPASALRRELAGGTLAQVPLREPYRVTLPTGVMVRRSAQHSAIVTAFLDVVSAMYGDARRPGSP